MYKFNINSLLITIVVICLSYKSTFVTCGPLPEDSADSADSPKEPENSLDLDPTPDVTGEDKGTQTNQFGIIRTITAVDNTLAQVREGIQNSSFAVVLEAQKAFARFSEQAPPEIRELVQRIGAMTRDNRQIQQLNDVMNQVRESRNKFIETFVERLSNLRQTLQNSLPTPNQLNLNPDGGAVVIPELPTV